MTLSIMTVNRMADTITITRFCYTTSSIMADSIATLSIVMFSKMTQRILKHSIMTDSRMADSMRHSPVLD